MTKKLQELRTKIDMLDDKILMLLVERFKTVELIGEYKKETKTDILQKNRAEEVINHAKIIAKENGINTEYFEKIYKEILDQSCKLQNEIRRL